MAPIRSVVVLLLCVLPLLQACALVPAQDQSVVVVDYSFFTGNLDSTSTPVTRVNGYSSPTEQAKCYVRVQYLADMPAAVVTGRFYEPDGALAQEARVTEDARKAGDASVWVFGMGKGDVAGNTGIWTLEVYRGSLHMLTEHFTVGDYLVGLSIRGFSPEYSVKVAVDGKEAGTIRGGEDKKSALTTGNHTVSVDPVVNATSYTRYAIKRDAWNASGRSSHTFVYSTQYYLNVTSPYGQRGSGWYNNGTKATFTAQSPVAAGSGIRQVFANWTGNIDEYTNSSDPRAITLMNGPKSVTANYRTQYYLRVGSQFGSPAGEGWYDQGATATVSVATTDRLSNGTVLLSDGGLLFLPNGTQIFFAFWTGDIVSSSNTTTILMDKPHSVIANWKVEASPVEVPQGQLPDLLIGGFAGMALVLFVILALRARRVLAARRSTEPSPPPVLSTT